jgi:hypothetical protein
MKAITKEINNNMISIENQEITNDQNKVSGGLIIKKLNGNIKNGEMEKNRKISLRNRHKKKQASRNITLMVIFQCFLYIFGNYSYYI